LRAEKEKEKAEKAEKAKETVSLLTKFANMVIKRKTLLKSE
jgi:hypothetical protein